MAVKLRFQGIEFECDSVEEAVSIAKQLTNVAARGPKPTPAIPQVTRTPPSAGTRDDGGGDDEVQRVCNLLNSLKQPQRDFVKEIATHPHGITDLMLMRKFNKDGKGYGGLTSPITRVGSRFNLTTDTLYTTRQTAVAGRAAKEYRPTALLRNAGQTMGWFLPE